jgi:hypothetical protein
MSALVVPLPSSLDKHTYVYTRFPRASPLSTNNPVAARLELTSTSEVWTLQHHAEAHGKQGLAIHTTTNASINRSAKQQNSNNFPQSTRAEKHQPKHSKCSPRLVNSQPRNVRRCGLFLFRNHIANALLLVSNGGAQSKRPDCDCDCERVVL